MPGPRASLWLRLVVKIIVLDNGCWHWVGGVGDRQHTGKTGRLRRGGRRAGFVQPHRQMLAFATGGPPTELHEACHACPFGDELCCNPLHLYWGLRGENEADKHDTVDE